MGRKIPGRKHHGVRDPEKQATVRFNKIKDKINTPPLHPDNQEVSKTLQRIIDLKNKTKNGEFSKKMRKKHNENVKVIKSVENRASLYEKPIPHFEQRPNETNRAFVHRMNLICMKVEREAQFEDKYKVEVRRDQDGKVQAVVKRPKDALEKIVQEIRREKKEKKKKKKSAVVNEPKLTKSQKWRQKKLDKLKHSHEKYSDFKGCEDVTFGDVVHAPPTLVTPKKVGKLQIERRPGIKDLLLKSILTTKKDAKLERAKKFTDKAVNKKGKRKDLPNALRRQLDNQQSEIINAYKQLKAKKYRTG